MRQKRSSRAVSPVIATLLLIAIAVAGSVVTYSWVMSMIRSQGSQAQTQIKIDSVEWTGTSKETVTVTVRNSGSVDAKITTMYVIDSSARQYKYELTSGNVVPPATTVAFTMANNLVSGTLTFTWSYSTSYTVRVVTDNGFIAEGTYSTQAST